jgi:DNA-binding transcriptional LysR family regulator
MLDMRHVEVFRALHVAGTMSAAARVLSVSQPAISRMIAYLEGRLGFALFERKNGRLYPTAEGSRLFEAADRAFGQIERIRLLATELRAGAGLSLRIAVNPSLSLTVAPLAVARFLGRHPQIKIDVSVEPSSVIETMLIENRADLGAVLLPLQHPAVTLAPIGEAKVVCIMPRGHALAAKPVVTPHDLGDERLISFETSTVQGMVLDDVFAEAGMKRRLDVSVRFAHTACHFAASGVGVALVDSFSAGHVPQGAVLRPFLPDTTFVAYAAHGAFRALGRLGAEFIEDLRHAAADFARPQG